MTSIDAGNGRFINDAYAQPVDASAYDAEPMTPEDASAIAASSPDETAFVSDDPARDSGAGTAPVEYADMSAAVNGAQLDASTGQAAKDVHDLIVPYVDAYTGGDRALSEEIVATGIDLSAFDAQSLTQLSTALQDPTTAQALAAQLAQGYAALTEGTQASTTPRTPAAQASAGEVQTTALTSIGTSLESITQQVQSITGDDHATGQIMSTFLDHLSRTTTDDDLGEVAQVLVDPELQASLAQQLVEDYQTRHAAPSPGAQAPAEAGADDGSFVQPSTALKIGGAATAVAGGGLAIAGGVRNSRAATARIGSDQLVTELEGLATRGSVVSSRSTSRIDELWNEHRSMASERITRRAAGTSDADLLPRMKDNHDLRAAYSARVGEGRSLNGSATDLLRAMDTDASRAALERLGEPGSTTLRTAAGIDAARTGVLEGATKLAPEKVASLAHGVERFGVQGGGLMRASRLGVAGGVVAAIGAAAAVGGYVMSRD